MKMAVNLFFCFSFSADILPTFFLPLLEFVACKRGGVDNRAKSILHSFAFFSSHNRYGVGRCYLPTLVPSKLYYTHAVIRTPSTPYSVRVAIVPRKTAPEQGCPEIQASSSGYRSAVVAQSRCLSERQTCARKS
ncbi:hypothetical protein V8C37DRAFT_390100 [Trichoderma ceciliae]